MIMLDVYGETGFAANWGWTPRWKQHVNDIKTTAGFTFNASRKCWTAAGPEVLLDLDRRGIPYDTTPRAYVRAREFKDRLARITELQARPLPDTPYGFQEVGSELLVLMERGLLADDRGMGKSKQALDAAAKLGAEAILVLIMFEGTLVYNWPDEVERWHPEWTWAIVPDAKPARLKFWDTNNSNVWIANSSKVLLPDWPIEAQWDYVIVDEIGRAKNRKTVTHKRMRHVAHKAKYFCGIGSPMEIRAEDTNAVFDLVRPAVLGNFWRFRQQHLLWDNHGKICGLTPQGRQLLNERIAPWMIHRDKSILGLPPVLSNTHYVELSPNERGVYDHMDKNFKRWLREQGRSVSENNALVQTVRFQQFVDSRALLEIGSSNQSIEWFGTQKLFTGSKYQALRECIDEWPGKVVVFTRFAQMASLLVKWLGVKYYIIGEAEYGLPQVKKSDRVATVKLFGDSNEKVLVSTDAGAYGLNIAADLIIHYDQLWNPVKMQQRRDRTHGIGRGIDGKRTNELHLICRGTIDEGMYKAQQLRSEELRNLHDGTEEAVLRRLGVGSLQRLLQGRL